MLIDLIFEYNNIEEEYAVNCKRRLKKQFEISKKIAFCITVDEFALIVRRYLLTLKAGVEKSDSELEKLIDSRPFTNMSTPGV
jgi:hypothetical protein